MPIKPGQDHVTVKAIKSAYYNDETLTYVIHGPRGHGKTVWSAIVGSQLVGTIEEPRWDNRLRKWLKFTPKQYVDMCLSTDYTQIWADWDDAGYWLNSQFWYEPFVKEAIRYSTLQRTQFSGLMLSTPSLTMMPKKTLQMEDCYRVRIEKLTSDEHSPNSRPRMAIVVKPWHSDYKNTGGCTFLYNERFTCRFPDDFFEWYQPVRKLYSVLAKVNMKLSLDKRAGNPMKAAGEEILEQLMSSSIIPTPEQIKELTEKIKQFATNLEIERMKKEDAKKMKKEAKERLLNENLNLIKQDVESWADKQLDSETGTVL